MQRFGAPSLFLFTAAVHTAMLIFTLVRLQQNKAAALHEPFAPLPLESSPASLQLDPRKAKENP